MNKSQSSNVSFGLGLFAQTLAQKPGENVFVSPASVEIALAMTLNGARGETRKAMASVLGLPARASLKQINEGKAGLIAALTNPDPKVELAIANALWARKDVSFKKPFLDRNGKFYGAQCTALDFDDEQAALARINGWCSEKTRGKIPTILQSIPRAAILYLMNAIYFKGAWTVEFDKTATRERDFTLLSGGTRKHPAMFQSGNYRYLAGEGFQAVSLPYGSGRVSMYIILPDKGTSLAAFNKALTPENWASWMSQFRYTEGDIVLPKFKLEYETDLIPVLTSLGMGIAFDDDLADFSGMCVLPGENVKIGQVKHKTYVDVNEEGTEAAAVTSIGMVRTTSIRLPRERFTMIVDRPFDCAIVDNTSGTLLFLGAIVEPK
ncbi:MAG TPA: serpin family protein [Candidatus Obscuribacterales bacterium]